MQSEELVEAAARRMAVVDGQNPDKLSHNSFEWWRHYVPMARAALEAALSAAEPVCCGKPVYEGSPEAYTLECCEKFIQSAPTTTLNAGAINALKNNQRQLDMDGCEVGVSRQALDEALAFIDAALSAQVQDVAERKPLDLNITKEWFEKRAALEGDHEIGAGRRKFTASIDPTPEELAELHRLVHRIPEGWKLVPKEPTATMAFAGINAVLKGQKYDKPSDPIFAADLAACNGDKGAVRAMQNYRAMIAAAPAKREG